MWVVQEEFKVLVDLVVMEQTEQLTEIKVEQAQAD